MKKLFVWVSCLVLVLGFGMSQANAAGFGFYASAGSGSGDWTWESGLPFDVDTSHKGAGFVLDTAVASDKTFNYQLNIGYDELNIKSSGDELDLSGLMISNAFGFGIVRTEGLRVWLGPEIRLAWPTGSTDAYDYDLFGLGFGPALGVNFNLPGSVTLGIKAGYQMMNYAGEATDNTGWWYDIDVEENMMYVNFSLMFRSAGDRF